MGEELVIEWDERKRRANLSKHGFDFADCVQVFCAPVYTMVDDRYDYGELRLRTVGVLHRRVVVVTHTERDGAVRVISLRRANAHEKEDYFKYTLQD